ncbi:MAG: NirD/YgiW/YdeI family stress tolerance protein [Promethearchaeota archaeon]|jgi:uncharacterized protein YdeI (BOF family)
MSLQSAKQRIIKDIRENDALIQVTGYVKNLIENDSFILDDNSGNISVDIKNVDFPHNENDLINVFGELDTKMDGEKIMIAKIIQDMNKLNFGYYLKLYELKKKYG